MAKLPSGEMLPLAWKLGVPFGDEVTVWKDSEGKWISSLAPYDGPAGMRWDYVMWGALAGLMAAAAGVWVLLVRSYTWVSISPVFLPEVRQRRLVVR